MPREPPLGPTDPSRILHPHTFLYPVSDATKFGLLSRGPEDISVHVARLKNMVGIGVELNMRNRRFSFLHLAFVLTLAMAWGMSKAQAPNANTANPQPPAGAGYFKFDPALDAILASDAKLEMLKAEGFEGGEGPVWVPEGKGGYLLFSDVPGNRIYKWAPVCNGGGCSSEGTLTVFQEHAGYKDSSRVGKTDASGKRLNGSNGLTLDRQHRLLIDATGDRAVERLEKDGSRTILADHYQGKHLGCVNDIAAKSDGAVYFTDGPAGCMEGGENSPLKELSFHGFYFVKDSKVQLLDMDPGGAPPNGITLSPDQKTLYVTNAPAKRQIFAYELQADDTVKKNPRVLIDLSAEQGLGGPDGIRVDRKGNVYAAATGGVWIVSPEGKRLGKVPAPEGVRFANLAFGDPDGKTLYVVSAKNLWRLRVKIPGFRP
jgi:gluconolactonase